MLGSLRAISFAGLLLAFAAPGHAAPAMFEASFTFHAWGNDISSGWTSPYDTNDWTALPLGYDCRPPGYTTNGMPAVCYCCPTTRQRGHPATGMWTRSIDTGTPPRITMHQSDFGVQLITLPIGTYTNTPHCCRGFLPAFPPYLQTFTYATFVNDVGSFFAGGGAAAYAGYNNRSLLSSWGTWRIRAGVNAFGGAMGLLGKFGAAGKYTITGRTGTYNGTSSWPMVKAMGRPMYGCSIGPPSCVTINPYSKTDMWYRATPKGAVKVHTILAIGSGTLWTTGQVGNFAKTGAYYTSLWRTGYDNRTTGGRGNIQLVTPTLTHWLALAWSTHSAQVGLLKIHVPEPGAVLLLAAGIGALLMLRRVGRRR